MRSIDLKAQLNAHRLLRLREASQYLRLSCWTLRRIVQQGQIPIIKTHENAPWLLDVRDLDAWIERSKQNV
jgi:excisionase family DNA binding protein